MPLLTMLQHQGEIYRSSSMRGNNLQHLHLQQMRWLHCVGCFVRYYDLLIARNFLTSQSVNIMV